MTAKKQIDIIEACSNRRLFARWFRDPATWRAWFVFLKALFGQPMDADELAIFTACTGRVEPPSGGALEAWLVVGRRGGKSLILAVIAVYLAAFRDWTAYLTPGERAVILVIATDRRQARVIYSYARALLLRVPALASLVEREDAEALELSNGLSIEIQTANFQAVRGHTVIAALLDEIAFLRSDDSANPDREIIDALRPAMATIPDAMLLCASSPYGRRGVLYDAYRKHYGTDGPVLVWRADTRTMNPTVPEQVIAEAFERDPVTAASEYGHEGSIEFRSDIETFITREAIDSVVVPDRHELAPISGLPYFAAVDPSGGTGDAMTLAVAHRDPATGRAILDALRERRPPFNPDDVVQEFAALLRAYGVSRVTGDRYGGEWPRERFIAHGIEYDLSEKSKSDAYGAFLPLVNSAQVELLDHSRLMSQLAGLERRTSRGGRDSIDHPPGAHDDLANVAALALTAVAADTAPRLWRRDQLTTAHGAPVPVPARADMVFATLIVGKRRDVGAVYFAHRIGVPLAIIDATRSSLSATSLKDAHAHLLDLLKTCRAPVALLFVPKSLATEAERQGLPGFVNADGIIEAGVEDLALSAALHVTGDKVKVASSVLERSDRMSIATLLDSMPGDDDPLALAALAGIAIALDPGRDLERAA